MGGTVSSPWGLGRSQVQMHSKHNMSTDNASIGCKCCLVHKGKKYGYSFKKVILWLHLLWYMSARHLEVSYKVKNLGG